MWIDSLLANFPPEIRTFLNQVWLVGLIIFLLWFVRWMVTRLALRPLRRSLEKSHNKLLLSMLDALRRPAQIAVFGIFVVAVSVAIGLAPELQVFGVSIGRALILAAVTLVAYNLVQAAAIDSKSLDMLTGIEVEPRLLPFLRVLILVAILVLGGLTILVEFRIDVTSLIASLGVVGLAFSLAAKDSASNIFGFAAIVADNLFEVGDYISTPDVEGTVEHVGIRSTRVRRLDQAISIVPNAMLADKALVNWTRLAKRRIDITYTIERSTSAAQLRYLLEGIRVMLRQRRSVDPESISVALSQLHQNALEVRVIVLVKVRTLGELLAEQEAINLSVLDIMDGVQFSGQAIRLIPGDEG